MTVIQLNDGRKVDFGSMPDAQARALIQANPEKFGLKQTSTSDTSDIAGDMARFPGVPPDRIRFARVLQARDAKLAGRGGVPDLPSYIEQAGKLLTDRPQEGVKLPRSVSELQAAFAPEDDPAKWSPGRTFFERLGRAASKGVSDIQDVATG